jgi:hypothetical protein
VAEVIGEKQGKTVLPPGERKKNLNPFKKKVSGKKVFRAPFFALQMVIFHIAFNINPLKLIPFKINGKKEISRPRNELKISFILL